MDQEWERGKKSTKVLNHNTELKHIVAMIDSTHIKGHMHATGAKGDNQNIGCTKGSLIRKFTQQ